MKKANRVVGMISRFIECKSAEIMVPLFKSLVRPLLEYGNAVWYPYLKKHITLIENVQRRFTKRIVGFGELEYNQRLAQLKLPSLEYRRCRGDMIEVFKITHGIYDSTTTSALFTYNKAITRGHPYKFTKVSTNTTVF